MVNPLNVQQIQDAARAVYSSYYASIDDNGVVHTEGRNRNNFNRDNGLSDLVQEELNGEPWELIASSSLDREVDNHNAYFIAVRHTQTGQIIVGSPGLENDSLSDSASDIWHVAGSTWRGHDLTKQTPAFIDFVAQVQQEYGRVDVLSGHSIAAQTAQAVGAIMDIPVVAFEPSGQEDLADGILKYAQKNGLDLPQITIEERLYHNVTNVFFTHPDERFALFDVGRQISRQWTGCDRFITPNNYVFENVAKPGDPGDSLAGHSIDPNIRNLLASTESDFEYIGTKAGVQSFKDVLLNCPWSAAEQIETLHESIFGSHIIYSPQEESEPTLPIGGGKPPEAKTR